MADGTLPLLKRGAKQPPKIDAGPPPEFYPERLACQVGTEGGTYFVQGKNLFSLKGAFVKEAPENLWYITTPEQESNNRKKQAERRAAVVNKPSANVPSVPDKVVAVAKENARALAAEAYAE